jgi:hypothetical protein
VSIVALAVVGLSLVPYVLGWAVQTPELVFGGFIFDLDDANSYLAVMQLGIRGEWRFISLYTPESQHGIWMHTFYILLGHVVRLTGVPLLIAYHGARVLCGFLLLMIVYKFARLFLRRRTECWTALCLVMLSSGIGWFTEALWPTKPGGISPIDFWFLDAYTFLGIFTFPHFTLTWTAMLVAFGAALIYSVDPRPSYLIVGGGAAFVATAVHPTSAVVMGGVMAVYGVVVWLIRRCFPLHWAIGGGVILLGAGVMGVYLLLASRADPVLSWYAQGIMQSPPPGYFVMGYGLLGPLALAGSVDLIRRRDERGIFLVSWVVVAFSLAYVPLHLQRRFVEGVHIPICVLASVGLHRCVLFALARSRLAHTIARLGYARRRVVWLVRSFLIVATWLSNIYLVCSAGLAVGAHVPTLFYSAEQKAAFDWLREDLAPDDTVLASYRTGNLIPAWTGQRVFLGHWSESVDWPERERQLAKFFGLGTEDAWRLAFLRQHTITYIFYGPAERALGGFDPTSVPWLELAFQSGDVAVYRVILQEGP